MSWHRRRRHPAASSLEDVFCKPVQRIPRPTKMRKLIRVPCDQDPGMSPAVLTCQAFSDVTANTSD